LNTIKNLVVAVTLLAVGYGAHVVLTKPVGGPLELPGDWLASNADKDQPETLEPEVTLGTEEELVSPAPAPLPIFSESVPPDRSPLPVQPQEDHGPSDMPAAEAQVATHLLPADSPPSPQPDQDASGAELGGSRPEGAQPAEQPTASAETPSPSSSAGHGSSADTDGFDAVWQLAKAKLQQAELKDALLILSLWYSDPQADEDQKRDLLPLLDQLAGTVIYSREHLLEPAYVVRENETLAQIAEQFQVPIMLLAKINGIASPDTLTAAERLKVVHGPFRAETSLSRRELTLFVGDLYAGRFPVRLGNDLPGREASLVVSEKSENRPYVNADSQTETEIAGGHPDNPYGQHWMGLRDSQTGESGRLAIHGIGSACTVEDPRACIGLSRQDAEDLFAILSVGSIVDITK
jgi:LysM repeat protein